LRSSRFQIYFNIFPAGIGKANSDHDGKKSS
jgi:hypothetical protein